MDCKKITIYFNDGNGFALNNANFFERMNAWKGTLFIGGNEKVVMSDDLNKWWSNAPLKVRMAAYSLVKKYKENEDL